MKIYLSGQCSSDSELKKYLKLDSLFDLQILGQSFQKIIADACTGLDFEIIFVKNADSIPSDSPIFSLENYFIAGPQFKEVLKKFQSSGGKVPPGYEYIDLKFIKNIFAIKRIQTTSRIFNKFEFQSPWLVKTTVPADKGKAEWFYLSNLSHQEKEYYPRFGKSQSDTSKFSYEIEFLPWLDLGRYYIHGAIDATMADKILSELLKYFALPRSKTIGGQELQAMMHELLVEKLDLRFQEFTKETQAPDISLKAKEILPTSLEKYFEDLISALKTKIATLTEPTEVHEIHGDLCLSNILWNPEQGRLKLIDPRGRKEQTPFYAPLLYDLAKLSHSIDGYYDWTINHRTHLVRSGEKMQIAPLKNFENTLTFQLKFRQWIEEYFLKNSRGNFDREMLKLAEASLFLSMLPFHIHNPEHVLLHISSSYQAFQNRGLQ